MPDAGCAMPPCIVPPDANVDTNPVRIDMGIDTGPLNCTGSGLVGSHCRMGACAAMHRCWDPATFMAQTIQAAFALQQASIDDPAHPGYSAIEMPQVAANSAPFNAYAGTFCAQECDTSARANACGACASCNGTLTQLPLVAQFGGVRAWYGRMSMFPAPNEGLCRLNCTWSPTTRGDECPDSSFTCSAFGSVCIEACTTDNECNTQYGVTYQGQLVTVLVPAANHPEHCNMTTGRCEQTGTPGATVGTACRSGDDCAPGSGLCFAGHCAEFGCMPSDTAASTCGVAANGVCLRLNNTPHPNTLCILGCDTTTDCGAGSVCEPFNGGARIGTHAGYCANQCATDDMCIAAETCTDYTTMDPTGATVSHRGRCVHRCGGMGAPIMVGQAGHTAAPATVGAAGDCLTTQWCQRDHMGANYGYCTGLGSFCGMSDTRSLPAMATDCATGQVCDETLATPHGPPTAAVPAGPIIREFAGDGHCTAPCVTTADCVGGVHHTGEVCVTTGMLAGLCRMPCTTATSTCPTDQVCDPTLMYCVEVPPPAM